MKYLFILFIVSCIQVSEPDNGSEDDNSRQRDEESQCKGEKCVSEESFNSADEFYTYFKSLNQKRAQIGERLVYSFVDSGQIFENEEFIACTVSMNEIYTLLDRDEKWLYYERKKEQIVITEGNQALCNRLMISTAKTTHYIKQEIMPSIDNINVSEIRDQFETILSLRGNVSKLSMNGHKAIKIQIRPQFKKSLESTIISSPELSDMNTLLLKDISYHDTTSSNSTVLIKKTTKLEYTNQVTIDNFNPNLYNWQIIKAPEVISNY